MGIRRCILSLCLICLACSSVSAKSEKTLNACYGNFPPYSQLDTRDRPHGVAIDLFLAVINELSPSTKVEFSVVPFARCLQMLKSGKADMVPMLAFDQKRTKFIKYSQPYAQTSLVLVSQRPELLGLRNVLAIPKNRYVLLKPRGTIVWPELAEAIDTGRFIEVAFPVNHIQGFDMLAKQHGDLVIAERFNAIYLLKRREDKSFLLGNYPLYQMPIHFGISKQSPWETELTKLNQILTSLNNKPYFFDYQNALNGLAD